MISDLFHAAAEQAALHSGRPVSQELAELRVPEAQPIAQGLFQAKNRYRFTWQRGSGPRLKTVTVHAIDEDAALVEARLKGFPGGGYLIELQT